MKSKVERANKGEGGEKGNEWEDRGKECKD